MNKTFIKTKNVKKFVSLMNELQNLPPNIPKIALVYGDFGLGKSETIKWWTFKNDCVYVRANQGMSARWLLSDIAEELNLEYYWHIDETFREIENYLINNPKVLIIDEVDYLIDKKSIETLRDLHDRTGCPLVLAGMGSVDKKLARYPHLVDRIYKKFKFETYDKQDIKLILSELSEIPITNDGLEYLAARNNQFRQIVKLVNKVERLAKTNQITELNEENLKGLLCGRILTRVKSNEVSELVPVKNLAEWRIAGGNS